MDVIVPGSVQVTVQNVPFAASNNTCELIQLKEMITILYQRIVSLEQIIQTTTKQTQHSHTIKRSTSAPTMQPQEIIIPNSNIVQDALKKKKKLKKTKAYVKKNITKLKKTTKELCEKNDSHINKTISKRTPIKKVSLIKKSLTKTPKAKAFKTKSTKTINIQSQKNTACIVEKK